MGILSILSWDFMEAKLVEFSRKNQLASWYPLVNIPIETDGKL
jgi:hypothetical protein